MSKIKLSELINENFTIDKIDKITKLIVKEELLVENRLSDIKKKFKKGKKVKTRDGNIETVLRVNSNANVETEENDYSHNPDTLELVEMYIRNIVREYISKGEVPKNWIGTTIRIPKKNITGTVTKVLGGNIYINHKGKEVRVDYKKDDIEIIEESNINEASLKDDPKSLKKIIQFLKVIGFNNATEENAKKFVGQYGLMMALVKSIHK